MSYKANKPGTSLSSSEVNAIASFVALVTTPAGQHLAKDASGFFVNTPDSGGGGGIILQTNGTNNGSQLILNLKQGTNITLTDDGVGGITINSSGGGSSAWGSITGTLSAQTDLQTALDARRTYLRATSGNVDASIASATRVHATSATLTAPRTLTLPLANTVPAGEEIIVTDSVGGVSSTNTLTIQRAGADTINSAISVVIGMAYGMRRFTSNGINAWTFDAGVLRGSGNLSELTNTATARTNLGLDNTQRDVIAVQFDGQGSLPVVGSKAYYQVPFGAVITGWTMYTFDANGAPVVASSVIDIWKDTYANYPATIADTITASAKPTVTTANKNQSSTLTGWTTSITSDDHLVFNLDSMATATKVMLFLHITKS